MSERSDCNCCAECRKDTVRLDWLADKDNPHGGVWLPRELVERNVHDMRAAIDEAMALDEAIALVKPKRGA